MNLLPSNPREKSASGLWLFVVGFLAMAVLTLGLAVGTSVWQRDPGAREFGASGPMAQK
jgi:hypothetical protein